MKRVSERMNLTRPVCLSDPRQKVLFRFQRAAKIKLIYDVETAERSRVCFPKCARPDP